LIRSTRHFTSQACTISQISAPADDRMRADLLILSNSVVLLTPLLECYFVLFECMCLFENVCTIENGLFMKI
jgi:hypothetical protein